MTPVAAATKTIAPATTAARAAKGPAPATAAKAPSLKDRKGGSTKLQWLNAQRLRIAKIATAMVDRVSSYREREPLGSKFVEAATAFERSIREIAEVAGEDGDAAEHLEKLYDLKWDPSSGPKPFRPGETITLKDNKLLRFTKNGAYTADALKELEVISVHGGAEVKVKVKRTGEGLGVWPLGWFRRTEDRE